LPENSGGFSEKVVPGSVPEGSVVASSAPVMFIPTRYSAGPDGMLVVPLGIVEVEPPPGIVVVPPPGIVVVPLPGIVEVDPVGIVVEPEPPGMVEVEPAGMVVEPEPAELVVEEEPLCKQ
jgi:hypothetical protein